MKRNELLNSMRPSKARNAVEMAMRPSGVTAAEMVLAYGTPYLNRMRALHMQGLATLKKAYGTDGHVAYHIVTDEYLSAEGLRAQQQRREAFERMQAEPHDYADYDDCND